MEWTEGDLWTVTLDEVPLDVGYKLAICDSHGHTSLEEGANRFFPTPEEIPLKDTVALIYDNPGAVDWALVDELKKKVKNELLEQQRPSKPQDMVVVDVVDVAKKKDEKDDESEGWSGAKQDLEKDKDEEKAKVKDVETEKEKEKKEVVKSQSDVDEGTDVTHLWPLLAKAARVADKDEKLDDNQRYETMRARMKSMRQTARSLEYPLPGDVPAIKEREKAYLAASPKEKKKEKEKEKEKEIEMEKEREEEPPQFGGDEGGSAIPASPSSSTSSSPDRSRYSSLPSSPKQPPTPMFVVPPRQQFVVPPRGDAKPGEPRAEQDAKALQKKLKEKLRENEKEIEALQEKQKQEQKAREKEWDEWEQAEMASSSSSKNGNGSGSSNLSSSTNGASELAAVGEDDNSSTSPPSTRFSFADKSKDKDTEEKILGYLSWGDNAVSS